MNMVRAVLPSLALVLLLILSIFPWGVAEDARNILPLLPVVAIIAMNMRLAHAVPAWIVFCAGVVLDAMTAGPLGFWALVLLCASALADMLAPYRGAALLKGWALGVAILAALIPLQWTLISLYAFTATPWAPLWRTTAAAALVFPLIDVLLKPVMMCPALRDNDNLVRGG